MAKLISRLLILAPAGGALYAYARLRTSASHDRLSASIVDIDGEPIR